MEQWVVPQGAVYSNKTNLLFFYLERLWLFTLGCVCLPCPWRLISQRPRHSLKFNVGVKGSRKDGAALQQTGCFLSPLIVHGECWSPSQHFSGAKVGCSSDKSAVRQRGPTQRDTQPSNNPTEKKKSELPTPDIFGRLDEVGVHGEAALTAAPLSWPCLELLALGIGKE